jgi:hypothetical protein
MKVYNLLLQKFWKKHQKSGKSFVVYQDDKIQISTGEEIKSWLENDSTEFP